MERISREILLPHTIFEYMPERMLPLYYKALFAFHAVYFVTFSSTTFLPKYFGELGMSDGQIGMLMSLPAIAGVLCQPFWGSLMDRVKLKKYVMIVLLALLAVVCFAMDMMTGFAWLMVGMTLFNILSLPVSPAYSVISLEYTRQIGRAYGPIRLMGTIGYQIGALVVGIILAGSLQGLYRLIGVVMALSCVISCFLPPVAGHQHGRTKMSMRELLRDKHLVALFAMVLLGSTTQQFYMSFFSKHLGDLGISNTMTGVMLMVSVIMELPFLVFGDRLARKMSIWNWLLIGFALNAVRWIGLAVFTSVPMLMLFQFPAVSVMACFEFFPSLYINRRTPAELKGSAQNALMIMSFGISKIIGGLLGGFVSEWLGIPMVFGINGILLVVACVVLYRPTRRLMAAEGNAPCE